MKHATLTPRKRLQMTLEHQDPGRVVVDLGATPVTGIQAAALARLRDALGLPFRKVKVYEPFQLLGLVEEDLRQALRLDMAEVSHGFTKFGFENVDWKPWTLPNGLEVEVPAGFHATTDAAGNTYLHPQGDENTPPSAMLPPSGYYFDTIVRGYVSLDDEVGSPREDFQADFPLYTDEQLRKLEKRCADLYENTSYGLIGGGMPGALGDFALIPGPGLKTTQGIRRIEDWLTAHYTHSDYVKEVFAMQTEAGLQNMKLIYEACGDKLQLLQISGTDFGTQRGPMLSPDLYREFYKPFHRKINDWVHQNTRWKTFFHSCGSVSAFLGDFVEAGVDVLNPVQISAYDMDARRLKDTWGDRLVFWGGGSNTQHTLAFGTPEEVFAETTELLSIFAPGGGYVFSAIHNIQATTPTENMLALFRAVHAYNEDKG